MSEKAQRFRKPPRRRRPPKQKRTKPVLLSEHVDHAHKVVQRQLKRQGFVLGQNKKDAAWHIPLNGDDRRALGPRRRQVNAIMSALWDLEKAGIIRHDGFGYRPCGRQMTSAA